MALIRSWKVYLEGLGLMAWAYTFLFYIKDHVLTESINNMSGIIDETFKLFTSIVGIVFLVVRIIQYRKEAKLKNENAKLDLEIKKAKLDLEIYELYEERARQKKNGTHKMEKPTNTEGKE